FLNLKLDVNEDSNLGNVGDVDDGAKRSTILLDSVSAECTPLKKEYDSCFNTWFEGYLEPAVSLPKTQSREEYSKRKAEEFQQKCGKMWEAYQGCVQVSGSL
ncbi:hypothetical protein MPER_08434, partial [Moniliophthora perniciosa FA553]